jgi:hypothetical protein
MAGKIWKICWKVCKIHESEWMLLKCAWKSLTLLVSIDFKLLEQL